MPMNMAPSRSYGAANCMASWLKFGRSSRQFKCVGVIRGHGRNSMNVPGNRIAQSGATITFLILSAPVDSFLKPSVLYRV
jgi:hypothetical protein